MLCQPNYSVNNHLAARVLTHKLSLRVWLLVQWKFYSALLGGSIDCLQLTAINYLCLYYPENQHVMEQISVIQHRNTVF
jgi:hypothetical protein